MGRLWGSQGVDVAQWVAQGVAKGVAKEVAKGVAKGEAKGVAVQKDKLILLSYALG